MAYDVARELGLKGKVWTSGRSLFGKKLKALFAQEAELRLGWQASEAHYSYSIAFFGKAVELAKEHFG